ncbi:GFA family protein [Afifella sp. IM 167]|uniref:GFA family protein n=1 Tax=Afifella sp. IM 167 TaxID=2033586 RepID=UPI001CCA9351|nr:GFA family protein [Afifella sp. IM 167]MBZ8135381.1 aldehyde-activating protein [Afifella sp. IM 167]
MTLDLPLHGRCFCGAITFEALSQPLQVSWCHCKDCRRQTGAPAVVWAGFPADLVTWHGEPTRRPSSPGIVRSFCAACGTPLSYSDARLPGEIYIHAGLFDEADQLSPDSHAYVTSKLFWLHLDDSLAKYDDNTRRRSEG